MSEGSGGSYLPFAGMSDLMWSGCLSPERFNSPFFFFLKQLYNLINFPQIPVSYDTGIILLKVKEFEAEWLMMKWERKKNAYATSDNWCGHSIKETQLALLFEWVPWCYLQSVLKVSGNPEKQAITGDVGRLRKENVIYMISFSIFLWSSFFFLNFSML